LPWSRGRVEKGWLGGSLNDVGNPRVGERVVELLQTFLDLDLVENEETFIKKYYEI
jgi:hypothetical protein